MGFAAIRHFWPITISNVTTTRRLYCPTQPTTPITRSTVISSAPPGPSAACMAKQALAFNGVESRVDINLPQQSDDLTLTAWINIDAMGTLFNDLLMSDGQNPPGGVYWYLRSDDFRSYFNILGARGPWRFSSEFSFAQFRRWMHLAVVYDHKSVKVRFHKDGPTDRRIYGPRHRTPFASAPRESAIGTAWAMPARQKTAVFRAASTSWPSSTGHFPPRKSKRCSKRKNH